MEIVTKIKRAHTPPRLTIETVLEDKRHKSTFVKPDHMGIEEFEKWGKIEHFTYIISQIKNG